MEVPCGLRVAQALQLLQPATRRPGRSRSVPPARSHPALVLHAARGAGREGRRAPLPGRGRIVAEVIIGLIRGDRQNYLPQDPDLTPTYVTAARSAPRIPSMRPESSRRWPERRSDG